jgi:hypothetical protein
MNPTVKNILITIGSIILGGLANSAIVTISPYIFPLPEGVDVKNIKSIADNISLYEPKHFLMPYLAHAIGTLVAAYFVSRFAVSHRFKLAMLCGVLFLIGGIMAVKMIPNSPVWFNTLDLVTAYIPMAWIGYKLGSKTSLV